MNGKLRFALLGFALQSLFKLVKVFELDEDVDMLEDLSLAQFYIMSMCTIVSILFFRGVYL